MVEWKKIMNDNSVPMVADATILLLDKYNDVCLVYSCKDGDDYYWQSYHGVTYDHLSEFTHWDWCVIPKKEC